MIEELQDLYEKGISITIDGEVKKIHFVLMEMLGDNLGVNAMFGFMESFTADYFCRFCRANKHETQTLSIEQQDLLRTEDNYLKDSESRSFGVKEPCTFNKVDHFHCISNGAVDGMHDIRLGVARYTMAKVINYCIKSKYFTL